MPTPPSRELFLYWRTSSADAEAAAEQARSLQGDLRDRHAGLMTRLFRRDEPGRGRVTFMESYALPGRGIGDALAQEIVAAGARLRPWLDGERHVEAFEPI